MGLSMISHATTCPSWQYPEQERTNLCIIGNMIVLMHVLIALSSIAMTTVFAASPSKWKLRCSAALIALTLGSGTYLVLSTHSPLLSSCLAGLAYLAVALAGVVVGAYRLSRKTV